MKQRRMSCNTLRVLRSVRKPFQLQLFTLTFYKGTEIFDLLQEKMGSADLGIRNYFNYRPTYLNKLVRISPLISSPMIDYFIRNREKFVCKISAGYFIFFHRDFH